MAKSHQLLASAETTSSCVDPRLDKGQSNCHTVSASVASVNSLLPVGDDFLTHSRLDETSAPKDSLLKLLTLVLHATWLVIHCALLVILNLHLESRIVLPFAEESNTFSSAIIAVSQAFVVVFSSLLLFLVQRVALQKILGTQLFLTTAHDNAIAWTGLGSALMTLYRQWSVPAALLSTLSITIYLAALAILHITTPSLLSMQPFNDTTQMVISSKLYSNIDVTNTLSPSFQGLVESMYNYLEPAKVLDVMTLMDISPTLGLQDSTLYDVISDNSGTGETLVGALSFDVSCGTLQNITASWISAPDNIHNISCGQYINLEWQYQDYQCNFSVPPYIPTKDVGFLTGNLSSEPSIFYHHSPMMTINCKNESGHPYAPISSVLFTSGMIFADSYHSNGSMIPPLEDFANHSLNMQVMGCTLSYQKHQVLVDVKTKQMTSLNGRSIKEESVWSLWEPEFQPPIILDQGVDYHNLNVSYNTFSAEWPFIFEIEESPWILSAGSMSIAEDENPSLLQLGYCIPQSIPNLEKFLLHILPNYNNSASCYNGSLQDLENALATMTAAYFWSAIQITPEAFLGDESSSGEVTIREFTLKYRLRLNLIPVTIGLSASFLLLLAFLSLARGSTKQSHGLINSLDPLQVVWISQQYPELFQRIADVRFPSTENLRAAGMVPMRLYTRHGDPIDQEGLSKDYEVKAS